MQPAGNRDGTTFVAFEYRLGAFEWSAGLEL